MMNKEDLIFEYIHGQLDTGRKLQVYNLIISDSSFKKRFIQELQFKKELKKIKYKLSPKRKNKIYYRIKQRDYIDSLQNECTKNSLVKWLYNLTLPEFVSTLINQKGGIKK